MTLIFSPFDGHVCNGGHGCSVPITDCACPCHFARDGEQEMHRESIAYHEERQLMDAQIHADHAEDFAVICDDVDPGE